MIQGKPASVDATKKFHGTVPVGSGTTTVVIAATDASGNVAANTYEIDQTASAATLTYDANGNLTSDGTRTFEWDAENRMVAINSGTNRSEFTFDGLDRRVRIVEKDSSATFRDAQLIWNGTAIAEERLSTGEVNRFFTDGEQHNGTARYLTRDHLGSVREVTDAAGAIVTRNDYDPYGRLMRISGTEDSRFAYTGHLVHAPSGLTLARYRAYDPALGRWLGEDPAGNVDGPNLYTVRADRPDRALRRDGLALGILAEHRRSGICRRQDRGADAYRQRVFGPWRGPKQPQKEDARDTGPIPRGDWDIGPKQNKPNTGPASLPLTPRPGTDTHKRDGFFVHGDNGRGNNSACGVHHPAS